MHLLAFNMRGFETPRFVAMDLCWQLCELFVGCISTSLTNSSAKFLGKLLFWNRKSWLSIFFAYCSVSNSHQIPFQTGIKDIYCFWFQLICRKMGFYFCRRVDRIDLLFCWYNFVNFFILEDPCINFFRSLRSNHFALVHFKDELHITKLLNIAISWNI